jgi:hypothetical protein
MIRDYIYSGPLSGVSLKDHGDVMLHPGCRVSLPDDHEYTARLLRKGWLAEVAEAAEEQAPEPPEDGAPEPRKRRK